MFSILFVIREAEDGDGEDIELIFEDDLTCHVNLSLYSAVNIVA